VSQFTTKIWWRKCVVDLSGFRYPRTDWYAIDLPGRTDILNLAQWPAMAVTVTAAWLVASQSKTKRGIGFWVFIVSNVLWIVWGWHDHAYALIFLQLCLAGLNLRGILKND
jgi:hypothetical protein